MVFPLTLLVGVMLVSRDDKGGGSGGGDEEYFPSPEIKLRQYFSSRARCARVLRAPFFSPKV